MTRPLTPAADRWALDTGTAIAASRGRVNLVANATLTPERARSSPGASSPPPPTRRSADRAPDAPENDETPRAGGASEWAILGSNQ